MLNKFVGNAILTKLRSMYGSSITSDEYLELLRKRSVGEIAAFLKSKPGYDRTLSSVNEGSIHRGRLEHLLHKSIFEKYERLYRYDTSPNRGFFGFVIKQFEIDEILRCMLYLGTENPEDFIAEIPTFMSKYASFDILSLASVKSYKQLIEVLEHTPYAKILAEHKIEKDNVDYTACEISLRNYFYLAELEEIKKFYHGATEKNLTELIKTSIELQNISIIFRAKLYYKKTDEQIYDMLCQIKNKLSKDKMAQLFECEDEDSFLKVLFSSYYGKYLPKDSYVDIENFSRRIKYLKDKQFIRFSTSSPVALYAFVDLCNIELFNITNIIEGIRYKVPMADIQRLLIM